MRKRAWITIIERTGRRYRYRVTFANGERISFSFGTREEAEKARARAIRTAELADQMAEQERRTASNDGPSLSEYRAQHGIEEPPAKTPGYVYFILDKDGRVKIGYSARSPRKRMATLQTAHAGTLRLLGFMRGDKSSERELHNRFAHLHIRGEWFRYEGELAKFIDGIR